MKLSTLMTGYTPNPDFEGFVTNDDMVLAVDLSERKNAAVADYVVVEGGITGLDSSMNPVTQDKQYIRAGQSTTKTGTQRAFSISGDRLCGDDFQDGVLTHRFKYGVGEAVNVPYVYFNLLNGKGERGTAAVIINSDGSGNAGDNAGVSIDLKKCGKMPEEYTYSDVILS